MSLLNLAWHQPLLIPLMGEALPQREGGRENGREREGCPHTVAREFLVRRRAWRESKPGSLD